MTRHRYISSSCVQFYHYIFPPSLDFSHTYIWVLLCSLASLYPFPDSAHPTSLHCLWVKILEYVGTASPGENYIVWNPGGWRLEGSPAEFEPRLVVRTYLSLRTPVVMQGDLQRVVNACYTPELSSDARYRGIDTDMGGSFDVWGPTRGLVNRYMSGSSEIWVGRMAGPSVYSGGAVPIYCNWGGGRLVILFPSFLHYRVLLRAHMC